MRYSWCKPLIFLIAIFVQQNTFAQVMSPQQFDSLLSITSSNKADSNTIKAFSEIQRYYFNMGLYDSTRRYVLLAIPVARKLNDKKRLGRMLYNAGMTYTNLTRYDSAGIFLDEGELLAAEARDTIQLLHTMNANSLLRSYQSDFSGAVIHLMKAASIIEKSGNPEIRNLLPQTYRNIGLNLVAENQVEKGIAYQKKALLIKNYPDENRYSALLHMEICDAYIKLKNAGAAKPHLDTASMLNDKLDNVQTTILLYNTSGNYYDFTGDYLQALKDYQSSYQLADSMLNEYLKSDAGANVARIQLKLGQLDEAEPYALESNKIAIKLNNYKTAADTYNTLKEIAAKKGDHKKAFTYGELEHLYKDSASNMETKKTILGLEARYQNEKKEAEIASLKLLNTQKELAVIKRNRWLIAGTIILIALLLISAAMYRNAHQKKLIAEKDKKLHEEHIRFMERQQQVVSLQSMINGQETERTRIAKDLHDGLGGLFSTIKMHFSTLQHEKAELKADPLFAKSYEMVNTASEEVRRIAHNMMPEVLIKLGLVQATQELCSSISAGKLLNVSFQAYGMDKRLNSSTEVMLFRILQELLNNIIKHSQATEAIIQFNRDGNRLSVTVEDNGRGFSLAENDGKTHAGLSSVESRVSYLNGKLFIDSQKEVGTTVMMDFLINE